MEINEITEHLKNDSLSPGELAEFYTQLAGWYSYYAQMMKRVKETKPTKWLEIKDSGRTVVEKGVNAQGMEYTTFTGKGYSDNHTDILWEATEDGQKEIALTWELKRLEQMMRSIKARLYINNQEANNTY